jgi:phosphatidylglycerophosphatase A
LQLLTQRETSPSPPEKGAGISRPTLRAVLASPSAIIATDFGFGLVPIWPGTLGSLLALPLIFLLSPLDGSTRILLYTISFPLLVLAAHQAASLLGEQDHPSIICDETWAMAVVWESTPGSYGWMAASFLVFRMFDVIKPWPIGTIDRSMKTGVGVMLDDAVAALYAIVLIIAVRAAMPVRG